MKLAALALGLVACTPLPEGTDVTDQAAPLVETALGVYQRLDLTRPRVLIARPSPSCADGQFEDAGVCVYGTTIFHGPETLVFVARPGSGLWSHSTLAVGLMHATGKHTWSIDDKERTDIEHANYWFSVSTIDEMPVIGGAK